MKPSDVKVKIPTKKTLEHISVHGSDGVARFHNFVTYDESNISGEARSRDWCRPVPVLASKKTAFNRLVDALKRRLFCLSKQ